MSRRNRVITGLALPVYLFGALAISNFAMADSGSSSSSGNGASCQSPRVNRGKPMLLDFALDPRGIEDPPAKSDQLSTSVVTDKIGIDYQDMSQTQAYRLVLQKIDAWERAQPHSRLKIADRLRNALVSILFAKTPYEYPVAMGDAIPANSPCAGNHIHAVLYYVNNGSAALSVISIPAWNRLGPLSQAGILIHDALRHIQLWDGMRGGDADLQRLTAHILLDPPRVTPSLDDDPFFNLQLDPSEYSTLETELCTQLTSMENSTDIGLTDLERNEKKTYCVDRRKPTTADVYDLTQEIYVRSACASSSRQATELSGAAHSVNDVLNVLVHGNANSDNAGNEGFLIYRYDPFEMAQKRQMAIHNFQVYRQYLTDPTSLTELQRESIAAWERGAIANNQSARVDAESVR